MGFVSFSLKTHMTTLNNNEQWYQRLLGKQWQVQWRCPEYQDDWYDATIVAVLAKNSIAAASTSTSSGTPSTSTSYLCSVRFVGEDDLHEMILTRDIVRPRAINEKQQQEDNQDTAENATNIKTETTTRSNSTISTDIHIKSEEIPTNNTLLLHENKQEQVNTSDNEENNWAQSLVEGYECEIFWKQDDAASTKVTASGRGEPITTSSSNCSEPMVTSKSEMKQEDQPEHENNTQQVEQQDSTSTNSSSEEEAEWYNAQILEILPGATPLVRLKFLPDTNEDDTDEFYQTVHELDLKPDSVRPSTRAWIERTQYLLRSNNNNNRNDYETWKTHLPPDTSLPRDDAHLVNTIPLQVKKEFPNGLQYTPLATSATTTLTATTAAESQHKQHHEQLHELLVLVKSQLYLRTQLALVEPKHGRTGEKTYVEYLVQCLEQLQQVVVSWYRHCEQVQAQFGWQSSSSSSSSVVVVVAAAAAAATPKLFSPQVLKDELETAKNTLIALVALDASWEACQRNTKKGGRKRTSPLSAPKPGSRAAKRRKKTSTLSAATTTTTKKNDSNSHRFWIQRETDGGWEFQEPEDGLVYRMVQPLVSELVQQVDTRWYTAVFGAMMTSLAQYVVTPLVQWEHKVAYCLGETNVILPEYLWKDESDETRSNNNNNNTATSSTSDAAGKVKEEENDSDNDTDGSMDVDEDETTKSPWFNYQDIQGLVDSSVSDSVLGKIDLSSSVLKLKEKVAAIAQFETRAWPLVESVLTKDQQSSLDKESDLIYLGLTRLLDDISAETSPLKHVEPMGVAPGSLLTRTVLQHALVYREWFLDLLYTESTRERVAFVEQIMSRFSELPSLPSPETETEKPHFINLSQELDHIKPRVQALSSKYASHLPLFNSFQSMLQDRNVSQIPRPILMTEQGVREALDKTKLVDAVSMEEEMMYSRYDILRWEKKAMAVYAAGRPNFNELKELFEVLCTLLQGKSSSRVEATTHLRPTALIDKQVREFAQSDVGVLLESDSTRTRFLYTRSSAWREKALSILDSLRSFGNSKAGERLPASKNPNMVDVKRIQDLIDEYSSLEVDLTDVYETLKAVNEDAHSWSVAITAFLCDTNNSLASCLEAVKRMGTTRPNGIIIDPTRQVVDLLEELLQWFADVEHVCSLTAVNEEDLDDCILQGVEVVHLYSKNRAASGSQFIPTVDDAWFKKLQEARKRPVKPLSVSKFTSSLACTVLERVLTDSGPIFAMLYWSWQHCVQIFMSNSCLSTLPCNERSLVRAKELMVARPVRSSSGLTENVSSFPLKHVAELKGLVESGDMAEASARDAISESKRLLKSFNGGPESLLKHQCLLKDMLAGFKSRSQAAKAAALCPSLEQQLEIDLKVFMWLGRALSYDLLRGLEVQSADQRIPWDVLVNLFDRIPQYQQESGHFAGVVLRVQELFKAADKWQREISSLTMLSLRGGKRRNMILQSSTKEDEESACSETPVLDTQKIAQLCLHPILKKVAMPREAGIKEFLESSKKFETAMADLLGKDYDGESPDRTAYPSGCSLMGDDGTFLLFRLTGSPMFRTLKETIANIAVVADKVFADTPGKAAFDWIRDAVKWIDELNLAITSSQLAQAGSRKESLVLSKESARHLLEKGKTFLLEVPEDLRKTLSQHKIQIYSSKEGKLTAKTTKGGSHHAIGVVAIRWCPFLYDSLKADIAQLEEWEKAIYKVYSTYNKFSKQSEEPSNVDTGAKAIYLHEARSSIRDLLQEVEDLVVVPNTNDTLQAKKMLDAIEMQLQNTSDSGAGLAFFNSKYRSGADVVDNRLQLLHCLSSRAAIAGNIAPTSMHEDIRKDKNFGSFRTACCLLLAGALNKGMETMGEVSTDENWTYCYLKAWEVEQELFLRFQQSIGASRITVEYQNKARALKRSMEDVGNVKLCARLLSGDLEAYELVSMTPEQLANPQMKARRAKAVESKQSIIQNSPYLPEEAKAKSNEVPKPSPPEPVRRPSSPTEEMKVRSSPPPTSQLRVFPAAAAASSSTVTAGSHSIYPPNLEDLVKAARSNRPPPPPPSLVSTLGTVNNASAGDFAEPRLISNTLGGDRFIINVAENSYSFMGGFYADHDTYMFLNGVLPELLKEKRRTPGDVLAKFVHDKLKSNKWSAKLIRLTTWSEKDASMYKKFYKDYESRDRVATFVMSDGEKLYLITPRFQRLLRDISFRNQNSAYGLILQRK